MFACHWIDRSMESMQYNHPSRCFRVSFHFYQGIRTFAHSTATISRLAFDCRYPISLCTISYLDFDACKIVSSVFVWFIHNMVDSCGKTPFICGHCSWIRRLDGEKEKCQREFHIYILHIYEILMYRMLLFFCMWEH